MPTVPFLVLRTRVVALADLVRRHGAMLWWLHSAYALALGVVFMWLGARNPAWLRVGAFNVACIWLTSMLVDGVVARREATSIWWRRTHRVIDYVNKNFYQQVLFFILPVYYASTTWWSPNVAFVALLAVSAVLSTLDLVYDRFLSVNRWRAAGFFSFNAFATVSVAAPVLLGISSHTALRLATLGAVVGFVTIAGRMDRVRRRPALGAVAIGAALVFAATELARPLVPPAPLRLSGTAFGLGLDRRTFQLSGPLTAVPGPPVPRLYATTALLAPAGLRDQVTIRWRQSGRTLAESSGHAVVGGRPSGFRLWSAVPGGLVGSAAPLTLEVRTGGGQLIGRAVLQAAPAS